MIIMDPEVKTMFSGLIEAQMRTEVSINALTVLIEKSHERFEAGRERLEAAHLRTEASIADLASSVARYIESCDARTKRLEENLDALIRAITREHSNGKAH